MKLEDIAKKAGVSRSTVSRVVNNDRYVSPRTRARVQAVIEAEGFSPNAAARALVTNRTQVIGIVIPVNVSTVFESQFYFPTLLKGVAQTTHARDYAMLLWMEEASSDRERFYENILKNRLMDGMIIASLSRKNPFAMQLVDVPMPVVMVERPEPEFGKVSFVTVDNVQAAFQAVHHLTGLGRHRIGTITGDLYNRDGADRLRGYIQALEEASLPYDKSLVYEGNFSRSSGAMGIRYLLERGVDAVFIASDMMASSAMDVLREEGIQVPEDIAIVGFDDLPSSTMTHPQLTTVHQPIQQKGAVAAEILIDLIEGKREEPAGIILPTELVIRESCGYLGR